jgi:hypothetical protein
MQKPLLIGSISESKALSHPYCMGMNKLIPGLTHTKLMHRLPSKASFALSLPFQMAALGAFSASHVQAQAAAKPSADVVADLATLSLPE